VGTPLFIFVLIFTKRGILNGNKWKLEIEQEQLGVKTNLNFP
jgi:hypothetical protein